jgi:hypothetical protein
MGFMAGVVTGILAAAGAAAWYLSRSGTQFRDQYRVEDRLAQLGDEMEVRARDLQASVNSQIAELRAGDGPIADLLDDASATAAEAEAAVEGAVDDAETKVKKAAKSVE